MSIKILPILQMIGFGLLAVQIKISVPLADFALIAHNSIVLVLALGGFILLLASGALFKRHNTTVNPLRPDKANTLVVSGLYRFSRNPMYLGFLCMLLAWVVYLGNLLALLVAPLFVFSLNHLNIIPEEKALDKRFGEAYQRYKNTVRRWI